jgi:hypothetical protein
MSRVVRLVKVILNVQNGMINSSNFFIKIGMTVGCGLVSPLVWDLWVPMHCYLRIDAGLPT